MNSWRVFQLITTGDLAARCAGPHLAFHEFGNYFAKETPLRMLYEGELHAAANFIW